MISQLLRPQLFFSISPTGELNIKELDPSAILKNLRIERVPITGSAFTLDYTPDAALKKSLGKAFSQLSCFIAGNHSLANKSCDLVLFSGSSGELDVILADLKSRSPTKSECVKQLRNSELFVDYLLSLLREYHGVSITPRYRKIVFFIADPIMAKRPTNQKNARPSTLHQGVTFFPVTIAGRNNGNAVVQYSQLV